MTLTLGDFTFIMALLAATLPNILDPEACLLEDLLDQTVCELAEAPANMEHASAITHRTNSILHPSILDPEANFLETWELEDLAIIPQYYSVHREEKTYGFSRYLTRDNPSVDGAMIRKLKPNEACVLRYLSNRVRHSKNVRENVRWFYNARDKIAVRFPWLKSRTISAIACSLEKLGALRRKNFNKMPGDRTTWYHVPDAWSEAADKDPIYFRPEDAKKYGLIEAVLLHNIRHWESEKRQESRCVIATDPNDDSPLHGHIMLPTELAKLLPFSKSAIVRALGNLVDKGVLSKCRIPGKRCSMYSIVNEQSVYEVVQSTVKDDMEDVAGNDDVVEFQRGLQDKYRTLCQTRPRREDQEALIRDVVHYGFKVAWSLGPQVIDEIRKIRAPGLLFLAIRSQTSGRFVNPPASLSDPWMHDFLLEAVIVLLQRQDAIWPAVCITQSTCPELYQRRCDISAAAGERDAKRRHLEFQAKHSAFWDKIQATENHHATAPEKKRILARELRNLKAIGIWSDLYDYRGQHKEAVIHWDNGALKKTEIFFSTNPLWQPSMLLKIIEKCAADREPAPPGFDRLLYVRHGNDLRYLLRHLDKIVDALGVGDKYPPIAECWTEAKSAEQVDP